MFQPRRLRTRKVRAGPHQLDPAGSAYVDPGSDVHIARNEGSTELVLIVARLLPKGAPARIDEPDPGNCHF
jgi:hypothetical protein